MKNIEFTSGMVRTLQGAPLSCLVLLMLENQPLGAQYIERHTGYNDKYVNSALLFLQELGLISRISRYDWQITGAARQLPLTKCLDGETRTAEIPDSQGENGEIIDSSFSKSDDSSGEDAKGVGKSESENPTPSSSRSLNPDLKELEVKEPVPLEQNGSRKIRVSENLAACDAAGIQEPKRTKLSQMPHVSATLIRYHVQTAPNLPLAIYRIEQNWRIKTGWVDPVLIDVCAPTSSLLPELPAEVNQSWQGALERVAARIREVDFNTWVRPLTLVSYDGQTYQVRACNSTGGQWVLQHASALLQEELQAPVQVTWEGKKG